MNIIINKTMIVKQNFKVNIDLDKQINERDKLFKRKCTENPLSVEV